MPSSPTHKNLDSLIEQPESGRYEFAEKITQTRVYCAKYSVCVAHSVGRGALGTGDQSGFQVQKCTVDSPLTQAFKNFKK